MQEKKNFIANDPLTNNVLNFLRENPKESFTVQELTENLFDNVTSKQVQLVVNLLVREGMLRAGFKSGKTSYQIRA
jgi:hypothetical protein